MRSINIVKCALVKISVRKINLIEKLINHLINIMILTKIKLIKDNVTGF